MTSTVILVQNSTSCVKLQIFLFWVSDYHNQTTANLAFEAELWGRKNSLGFPIDVLGNVG